MRMLLDRVQLSGAAFSSGHFRWLGRPNCEAAHFYLQTAQWTETEWRRCRLKWAEGLIGRLMKLESREIADNHRKSSICSASHGALSWPEL